MKTLGIVAGNGQMPLKVIEACLKQKRPFFVMALKNQADPNLYKDIENVEWFRVGQVGHMFKRAHFHSVSDVVMIGGVRRPSLSVCQLRPDFKTLMMLLKVGVKSLGDDGLLRAIISEVEKEGFHVVGADSILGDTLAGAGVYGKVKPNKAALKDIAKGFQTAKALGRADVGQSVVVADGLVLAVEAIEGTDNLLLRSKGLARSAVKPVLVKVKKPQQESRVDLPTIGVQTVKNAAKSGFAGIAVEKGSTFVVNKKEMVGAADKLGLFVIGVDERCLNVK